jgi:hypothetical protein
MILDHHDAGVFRVVGGEIAYKGRLIDMVGIAAGAVGHEGGAGLAGDGIKGVLKQAVGGAFGVFANAFQAFLQFGGWSRCRYFR